MANDIAIRDGMMVDGTGAEAAAADVDIAGGIVTMGWHGVTAAGKPIDVAAGAVLRDRRCAS